MIVVSAATTAGIADRGDLGWRRPSEIVTGVVP